MKSRLLLIALAFSLVFSLSMAAGCKTVQPHKPCTHEYGDWIIDTDATCIAEGSKHHVCNICKNEETETIAIKDHTYGDWIIDLDATCTEAGSKHRVCTVCENNETETIAIKDHTYGDWIIDTAATCTEAGSKHRVCSLCEDEETETIAVDANAHSYGEWITDKTATCIEAGSKHRVCSLCENEDTETVAVDANAHSYGEWITDKVATCTEAGSKHRVCSLCENEDTETVTLDSTVHNYGEWVTDKTATCSTAGSKYQECANCHDKIIDTIPATNDHTVGEDGLCTVCGAACVSSFTKFAEAVNDAECSKIVLMDNLVNETVPNTGEGPYQTHQPLDTFTLVEGRNLTVDFNGYILTTAVRLFKIQGGATLNLENSDTSGKQSGIYFNKVDSDSNYAKNAYGIYTEMNRKKINGVWTNVNRGILNINKNVTVAMAIMNASAQPCGMIYNCGQTNMNGGELIAYGTAAVYIFSSAEGDFKMDNGAKITLGDDNATGIMNFMNSNAKVELKSGCSILGKGTSYSINNYGGADYKYDIEEGFVINTDKGPQE